MENEWKLIKEGNYKGSYFFIIHNNNCSDSSITTNYPADRESRCWRCRKQIPDNLLLQWRLLTNK